MIDAKMIFPSDFRWGTATASYQVEGNNTNSDWWLWEQDAAQNPNGHRTNLACNWWQDAESDLDRAVDLGTNAHRMSLEWSRIEPEPSVFDEDAIARYRQLLQGMHNRGIEPMVTLHHFSNPIWLSEKGDFHSDIVVDYFRRYVAKVVSTLGDLIPKWIPINEPMVYVFLRNLSQEFPTPQQPGWVGAMRTLRNMLHCHAAAYHVIKEALPGAEVGVAKNMTVLQPKRPHNLFDKRWARWISWLYNDMWMDCVANGRLHPILGRGKINHLANSLDFVGINYYTRFYVKFPPLNGILETEWGPGAVVSDGNYGEVYPAGLFQMIKRVLPYQKPIYITENGVPDRADLLRPSFIITHLREIWRAISFNFPVMGYYHWSLIDNFEWDRGWTQRFGLIELDVVTQKRTLRKSGRLYGEICRSGCVSSDMAARYAPMLMNTLFRGEAPSAASR